MGEAKRRVMVSAVWLANRLRGVKEERSHAGNTGSAALSGL